MQTSKDCRQFFYYSGFIDPHDTSFIAGAKCEFQMAANIGKISTLFDLD